MDAAVEALVLHWEKTRNLAPSQHQREKARKDLQAALPAIRAAWEEEMREKLKDQGVMAMIKQFQEERPIELMEWGPRLHRLMQAALDTAFEQEEGK